MPGNALYDQLYYLLVYFRLFIGFFIGFSAKPDISTLLFPLILEIIGTVHSRINSNDLRLRQQFFYIF